MGVACARLTSWRGIHHRMRFSVDGGSLSISRTKADANAVLGVTEESARMLKRRRNSLTAKQTSENYYTRPRTEADISR